jgi:hypothetical protein
MKRLYCQKNRLTAIDAQSGPNDKRPAKITSIVPLKTIKHCLKQTDELPDADSTLPPEKVA